MHDGDYYRRWASAIGPDMYTMIDRALHSSKHEEQSYNSCNGFFICVMVNQRQSPTWRHGNALSLTTVSIPTSNGF